EDEADQLIISLTEKLENLNHYCFAGARDFMRSGFRVLFAGGGTGDGTIFLAEQLYGTDAEIVHLDISEKAMEIAKARAELRGLDNITWQHGSLLDLPNMKE